MTMLPSTFTWPASTNALSRVRDSAKRRSAAARPRKRSSRSSTSLGPASKRRRPEGLVRGESAGGESSIAGGGSAGGDDPLAALQARCLALEFTAALAAPARARRGCRRRRRRDERAEHVDDSGQFGPGAGDVAIHGAAHRGEVLGRRPAAAAD